MEKLKKVIGELSAIATYCPDLMSDCPLRDSLNGFDYMNRIGIDGSFHFSISFNQYSFFHDSELEPSENISNFALWIFEISSKLFHSNRKEEQAFAEKIKSIYLCNIFRAYAQFLRK